MHVFLQHLPLTRLKIVVTLIFLGYAFAQLEAPTAYMSNDFSAVSYLNVKTGKTYPRTTGKIKLHFGHRIIVDKASAYGAKGPRFKTQWRQ